MKIGKPKLLEWVLAGLARGTHPIARAAEFLIFPLLPWLAAAVEYRRGNLTNAKRLSKRANARVFLRSSQMLTSLATGYDTGVRERALKPFNRKVLFALHSSPSFDLNGYAVRTCQAMRALGYRGIEVVAATRLGYPWDIHGHNNIGNVVSSSFEDLVFHHKCDERFVISGPELEYMEAYAGYLAWMAEKHSCTVIHSHSNFLNGLAATRAAKTVGALSVYEMRGLWHLTRASVETSYEQSEHFKYCERMEIEAAANADKVVTISSAMADWLVQRGVNEQKILLVGNAGEPGIAAGAQTHAFKPVAGSLHVGYVGALTFYEGLDTLLHATKLLLDTGFSVRVSIAGDGPYASELIKLSKKLRLESYVKFLGRVSKSNVSGLYQQFDVCPLPRHRVKVAELVPPLKPYEIMLHGVPIVVSNLPPLAEIVGQTERGLLCEPDSASSLAECIRTVANNPEDASTMAAAARKWVEHTQTWAMNGGLYEKLYLAGDGPLPDE